MAFCLIGNFVFDSGRWSENLNTTRGALLRAIRISLSAWTWHNPLHFNSFCSSVSMHLLTVAALAKNSNAPFFPRSTFFFRTEKGQSPASKGPDREKPGSSNNSLTDRTGGSWILPVEAACTGEHIWVKYREKTVSVEEHKTIIYIHVTMAEKETGWARQGKFRSGWRDRGRESDNDRTGTSETMAEREQGKRHSGVWSPAGVVWRCLSAACVHFLCKLGTNVGKFWNKSSVVFGFWKVFWHFLYG